MPEIQESGITDSSKYEKLTTEELEEILRRDADACEGEELEADELLGILEVLAGRETAGADKRAEKAWNSFQQDYLPHHEGTGLVMPKKRASRWSRRGIAVAASVAIVCCVSVVGSAIGWGRIYKATASWTKDIFTFGKLQEEDDFTRYKFETDHAGLQTLYDAVEDAGITDPVVPMWIPEGYELVQLVEGTVGGDKKIVAAFERNGEELVIGYRKNVKMPPGLFEKSDDPVEEYEFNGVTYYIFKNKKRTVVAWMRGNLECYINLELDTETAHKMIDSIHRSE